MVDHNYPSSYHILSLRVYSSILRHTQNHSCLPISLYPHYFPMIFLYIFITSLFIVILILPHSYCVSLYLSLSLYIYIIYYIYISSSNFPRVSYHVISKQYINAYHSIFHSDSMLSHSLVVCYLYRIFRSPQVRSPVACLDQGGRDGVPSDWLQQGRRAHGLLHAMRQGGHRLSLWQEHHQLSRSQRCDLDEGETDFSNLW